MGRRRFGIVPAEPADILPLSYTTKMKALCSLVLRPVAAHGPAKSLQSVELFSEETDSWVSDCIPCPPWLWLETWLCITILVNMVIMVEMVSAEPAKTMVPADQNFTFS
jgi:hypothetical protein